MSVVLTRFRALNALRAYWSYALSRVGSARFLTPYTLHHTPLFISVEPAAVCQLRCPACPVGQRSVSPQDGLSVKNEVNRALVAKKRSVSETVGQRSGLMPLEVFRRILAECRETAWIMQFYFQGEPLLNKDLPLMIREAHEAGLYTIVSTNAQALTESMAQALVNSGLDRIIVSMDGLTDESYNAYRVGGSLEKTKAALQYLRKAKSVCQRSGPIVELQVLRLKTNEHEWAEFKRQYKTLGADRLVFKTAQLYNYANGHPLMPSQAKYSRYLLGEDGNFHRRKLSKGCWRVWSGVVVTTNGDVLPCCYDKSHAYAYGNIMDTPLKELFANNKAMAFRKTAFQQFPKICQECWK